MLLSLFRTLLILFAFGSLGSWQLYPMLADAQEPEYAPDREPNLVFSSSGFGSEFMAADFLYRLSTAYPERTLPVRPEEALTDEDVCDTLNRVYAMNESFSQSVCDEIFVPLISKLNGVTSDRINSLRYISVPDIAIENYQVKLGEIPSHWDVQGSEYIIKPIENRDSLGVFLATTRVELKTASHYLEKIVEDQNRFAGGGTITFPVNAGEGVTKTRNSRIASSGTKPGPLSLCHRSMEYAAAKSEQPEANFMKLFSWMEGWIPTEDDLNASIQCNKKRGKSDNCAEISLFDQEIEVSGDLNTGFIRQFDSNGLQVVQEPVGEIAVHSDDCVYLDELPDNAHGTHLASILASKPDGRGFVGISPGSSVNLYPWTTKTRIFDFRRLYDVHKAKNRNRASSQIFVFASNFPHPGPSVEKNNPTSYKSESIAGQKRLFSGGQEQYPWQGNDAALAVYETVNGEAFWVLAAGQSNERMNIYADELNESSAFAPQNMGNLKHVIIATSCDPCGVGEAKIARDTFWGEDFVHVAAPAENVVAPIGVGRTGKGSGTSQAAVMVAGIAASMVNKFPNYYSNEIMPREIRSGQLKRRIIVTSRPVFYGADQSSRKLSGGVLDPAVALLDPKSDWISRPEFSETQFERVEVEHWCFDDIELVDENGATKVNSTENILRLHQIALPEDHPMSSIESWVIYSADPPKNWQESVFVGDTKIDKTKPRGLVNYYLGGGSSFQYPYPITGDTPILKLKSGEFIRSNQFNDLILDSEEKRVGACDA